MSAKGKSNEGSSGIQSTATAAVPPEQADPKPTGVTKSVAAGSPPIAVPATNQSGNTGQPGLSENAMAVMAPETKTAAGTPTEARKSPAEAHAEVEAKAAVTPSSKTPESKTASASKSAAVSPSSGKQAVSADVEPRAIERVAGTEDTKPTGDEDKASATAGELAKQVAETKPAADRARPPARTATAGDAVPRVRELLAVPGERLAPAAEVDAILRADHRDPFGFLGMRSLGSEFCVVVRTFLPQARAVSVVDTSNGQVVACLDRVRDEGFFAGSVPGRNSVFAYRLRITTDLGEMTIDDAYRFPPFLEELDAHLLAEGNHLKSFEKLGAHRATLDGVAGVAFAVWAPNASRVAVVGDFNGWDGRCHGMRLRHECGVWEIFVPGVDVGALYKFEIKSAAGEKLIDKADPYAFQAEPLPGTASVVCDLGPYRWGDSAWMKQRQGFVPRDNAISVYQLHAASWRRKPEEGHRCLTYQELADELVGYVKDMGFTHIQLLPIAEYDNHNSLGGQTLAPFAPTSRWGSPSQLRLIVDRCHQAGIGVVIDWVAHQFSSEPHGLGNFDGTHLYEHPDAQRRRVPGANSLAYDFGRREVANYLISNALFWLETYHLDGLRVPSVEKMLYLDYGRGRGEWTANRFGGHENLEAVDFLRRLNERVYANHAGVFTLAEETSAWQQVSRPTFVGGLGFGFRGNAAWVRDVLRYFGRNPVHRKYYHDELLRGPNGAFQENYIIGFSFEDVAFGRGSLLSRMPGDRWQRFANLRALYALMYAEPGKKLLFMGDEFAQDREWNSDISLDWHLLGDAHHQGVQRLVRDLNSVYRSVPALHELDGEADGFEWIDDGDFDQSVLSFLRKGKDAKSLAVCVSNFTPVVRRNFRIGVPMNGYYRERLNTDAEAYAGSNIGNAGGVEAKHEPAHRRPYSIDLNLPPFSTVILEWVGNPSRS